MNYWRKADRYIEENRNTIYAGILACAAIAMFVTGGVRPMHTVKLADGYYASCEAARLADVAPIMRSERGYRAELDPDGDGVACEPWKTTASRN